MPNGQPTTERPKSPRPTPTLQRAHNGGMIRSLRAFRPGWLAWSASALSAGAVALALWPVASLAQAQPEQAAEPSTDAPQSEVPKPWRGLPTVAEASGYKATSRDADVQKFLTDLKSATPRAKLIEIGKTLEGRSLTMALIADPPLEIDDPRTRAPDLRAAARAIEKSGKVLVLAIGNIHGGEVDAKEALLALARELALPEKQDVLKHVVVALLPNYNADGNERIAKDTRPGQVGPEDGQGQRENAQGLDLNRDFVKLEAPETRALVRAMNILDPAIFIDGHTTNGSFHRYPLTFAIGNHPAGDRGVYEYAKDKLIPDLQKRAKAGVPVAGGQGTLAAKGFDTFWYGNYEQSHTQWRDFAADPRYSTNYAGLRGRIAVLTEAYNYITYQERIEAQHAFIRAVIEHAAANKDAIKDLVKKADEAGAKLPEHRLETGATDQGSVATGQGGDAKAEDALALRAKAAAWPDKVTTLGFDETEGAPRDEKKHPTAPKEYEVELWTKWEGTLSTPRAWTYVLPADVPGATAIAEVLQRHGIAVEELREETQVEVEVLKLSGLSKARPFQNHEIVTAASAERHVEWRSLKPGTFVVRGAQKRGILAGYLLEPLASDGLFAWNFFDAAIGAQSGTAAEFPVLRVLGPTPMLSTAIVPLAEDREPSAPITFERLWSEGNWKDRSAPNLGGSPAGGMQWLEEEDGKDGKASAHWLTRRDGKVWKVEARTGKATIALDAKGMSEALAKLPTIAEDRSKGLADGWLGKTDKARSVALLDHENDLYAAKLDGSQAVRLTSTPDDERGASISPDGQFAAYVKGFNVHVVDVATQRERALTSDGTPGSGDIRNGWLSWVYFEEVFGRRWTSLWWSPDSKRLAYLRTDESMVPKFPIVNAVPKGQVLEQERYPQPGQNNPHVTVWTVPASGGAPSQCDLSDYDPGHYIVQRVAWWPDGKNVYIAVTNRVQNWADILSFPAGGGKGKKLMRLTTGAWIDNDVLDPVFLDDGSFLLLVDASGRRHIEKFSRDGKRLGTLTSGAWDVRTIEGIDRVGKGVLFSAYKDARIATNLYRASLEPLASSPSPAPEAPAAASGEVRPASEPAASAPAQAAPEPEIFRLTHEPGVHNVNVSPDGSMFIDTWSTIDTPARVTLRSTADGSAIRILDTNPVHSLLESKLAPIEHVTIKTKDGVDLPGTVMRPIGFDASVKHPVWFMTYAGPMAPSVSDSWGSGRTGDQALASEGIIVFRADPRTSLISPALAWTTYKQMGVQELEDIKACIEWIKAQPGVDPDRIGISGFSFGGYITAYAMTHSDLFAAGISGAPPTDWRDYDTIYTERYMLTPQENPDGYDKTSVTRAADKLHGELMLVHGMMDDNVHLLNTTRLVKALQEANKQFEMMLYPENRHGVGQSHWRKAEAAFIKRTMKPTPIAEVREERQTPAAPAPPSSESQSPKEPIRGPGGPEPR